MLKIQLYKTEITFYSILQPKIFILNCNNISQYYSFNYIFIQINAALVSIKDLKKILPQTFER